MPNLEVYSKEWCPYCAKAKALLKSKGLSYQEINVTSDEALQQQMITRSGRRTVPQIFLGGVSIGGYDDLANLNATGELDKRLGRKMTVDHTKCTMSPSSAQVLPASRLRSMRCGKIFPPFSSRLI